VFVCRNYYQCSSNSTGIYFEIQDKTYVYVLGKDKKVTGKPVKISGKTEHYYFISEGL
jgi:hypothetical protein